VLDVVKIKTMRSILLYLGVLLTLPVWAQNNQIYNDDPMQKVPLGLEESEYFYRDAKGATFSGAECGVFRYHAQRGYPFGES
jgi:hypothetical protein